MEGHARLGQPPGKGLTVFVAGLAVKNRCEWAKSDPLMRDYHDREWGVPVHSDHQLFEFLVLEGAQAGLSWITILKKRAAYREAFDGFDPACVAGYGPAETDRLLKNPGIVRNRLKITAAIANAAAFLKIQEEFGSFDAYIWQFSGGATVTNSRRSPKDIPAWTPGSAAMSRELKRRGFGFVGPTICYAFMQAVGMVNDHTVECFRYREILNVCPDSI